MVRVIRAKPLLVTALAAITLACLVHPALGLLVLLFSHGLCCHTALCRYVLTSISMDLDKSHTLAVLLSIYCIRIVYKFILLLLVNE